MNFPIFQALRERFSPPDWAYLQEVADATGTNVRRRADGIAMSLWPSRGLEIHGVEVKVSRADWLKELKDVSKSAPIQAFCDKWWVAVSDEAIVKKEELPSTWGLLAPRNDKLVVIVQAPKLNDPKPVNRNFLASLLRCATTQLVPADPTPERLKRSYDEGYHAALKVKENDIKVANDLRAKAEKIIFDFQKASGVYVNSWNAGQIGETVNRLTSLPKRNQLQGQVLNELNQAKCVVATLTALVEELKKMEGTDVTTDNRDQNS